MIFSNLVLEPVKNPTISNIPYTYLIGWSWLDIWYYGRRTAKGCHPDDLWVSYWTSSLEVERYRELHGEPDIIIIKKTFESHETDKCALWEHKVLRRLDAARHPKMANKHNGSVKFDTSGMISVRDKDGNTMSVTVDDPRYISKEYVGVNANITHKTIECNFCSKTIGINNIKIHETTCKSNPNRIPGPLSGRKSNSNIKTCQYCGRIGVAHGISRHENSCKDNPNPTPHSSSGQKYMVNPSICQYCSKEGSKSGITRHQVSCTSNPNRKVRKNKPRVR